MEPDWTHARVVNKRGPHGTRRAFDLRVGHTAGVGYDMCTGLGSPKPAMVLQLASPTPLHPILEALRVVIGTGNATAVLRDPDCIAVNLPFASPAIAASTRMQCRDS
jgi:hypothetical protein